MSKILLINYRYFISGGPEKYMFNIKKIFEQKGHTVIPFSIKNKNNNFTEYEKYFVPPIGGEEAVYFNEYKKNLKNILQMISRSFYSFQVKKALEREIKLENPDVVYILNHTNKLSPSIINAAKKYGKKVVLRLSDFSLLCPRFDFLYRGDVCSKCLKGSLLNGIKHNCVQGSKIASTIRVASMYFHRLIKIYPKVDCFITPSAFLKQRIIEFGFNESKVVHIPTFCNLYKINSDIKTNNYITYIGRVSKEKGVEYAVRAMAHIKDKDLVLKIVGDANDDELDKIKQIIKEENLKNVELLGFKSGDELETIISNSKFTIVPSIWYDNMPNVMLEAFSHGKPIIASNLGSLPEVVDDKINGLLFEPKNSIDLAEKINYLNENEHLIVEYGKNARRKVDEQYNSEVHYKKLSKLLGIEETNING